MAVVREEVPHGDRWKVEAFYPDLGAWEAEFQRVAQDQKKGWKRINRYRDRIQEANNLKELLQNYFSAHRIIVRLYTYSHLRNDEDLSDDAHKAMFQRSCALFHEFGEATSWIEPQIVLLPSAFLDRAREDESLRELHFYLEKLARKKPYTLSPREEELVAMSGRALSAPSLAFSMLTNADFRFGSILDAKGREHELTQGSYRLFQRHTDRTLRENAFKGLHLHYKAHENALCELFTGQVQAHLFLSRAHRFSTCLEAALFPACVEPEVYNSLVSTVNQRLGDLHRYLSLRKRVLNLKSMHLWDLYVPLVDSSQRQEEIDYEEGVDLVIESVAPLGREYQQTLCSGLKKDGWVDRYENRGKRSGAYSSGCFDSFPYILMNYKGLLNDVFTLAHEAGHSMHSHLSHTHQPYHYSDYPIFVAEVASTFNEELLFRFLLQKAETKEERAFLLNQKIDDLRATLFRQTMFAEFELHIHEMAQQNQPLTPSILHEIYRSLNQTYFGNDIVIDDEIDIEWARIPHFYYNFYVYQYATGVSAALSLAKRVMQGGPQEREAYLSFLQGGGSRYPLDLLKEAGVDMTTSSPIESALDIFRELVDELESALVE